MVACLSPSRTSLSQTVPRKPPFSLALSPFPSTCRTREKQSQKSIQQINKSEKKDTKMESLIPTTISSSTSLTLLTCFSSSFSPIIKHPLKLNYSFDRKFSIKTLSAVNGGALMSNSLPQKSGMYTVGDFMTKKELLHAVKPTTTIDEALELLVENRITGFPVIDDDWKLVGLVSDYDLLALDSVSGAGVAETNMFPEADSSWKTFNEIQKLLTKTNGKVVADVMTPAPLVVRETTNLEDAARLLLETKYRRLPVVDSKGKLVGIITRGNVVRAALQIKKEIEKNSQ